MSNDTGLGPDDPIERVNERTKEMQEELQGTVEETGDDEETERVTAYLTKRNFSALDMIRSAIYQREGERVNRSDLINIAVNMLREQYTERYLEKDGKEE